MSSTPVTALRRRALLSVIVVGAIVTAVGGTGIFAVFTDRATTGPNSASSGERAKAADLQLAMAAPDANGFGCGIFADDLANPFFSVSDFQPGDEASRLACVRNVGSAELAVSLSSIDVLESDPECTGDEASVNPTCGEGDGAGQLGIALQVRVERVDCNTAGVQEALTANLSQLETQPMDLPGADLAPGETACLNVLLRYPAESSEELAQIAQSDSIVWRFAFDGTTLD